VPEREIREDATENRGGIANRSGDATRWRDLCVAASLANLIYLRIWAELLTIEGDRAYGAKLTATPAAFISLMVNVLLVAALLWGVIAALRAGQGLARKVVAPIVSLALLVVVLNTARSIVGFVEQHTVVIGTVFGLFFMLALVAVGDRVYRVAYGLVLVLSPFVLFTFGQASYRIATYDPSNLADGPLAGRLPSKPDGTPRVVWVIFDEWDDPLTFSDRRPGVSLVEIDRLTNESFVATNAVAANTMTDVSMPALISGVVIDQSVPNGPSELRLRLRGSTEWLDWSRQPNVFSRARDAGFNTVVVGWSIPYCRVLNPSLSDCWWWPGSDQYNSMGSTFWQNLVNQPRSLFETQYRSAFGASLSTHHHAWSYVQGMAKALEVAADDSYGLALLHLPIPHPPYFYDADTDRNDFHSGRILENFKRQNHEGYFHALALVDKTIGSLRMAMEEAGVWNSTTVIFSSDHSFRHRQAMDGKAIARTVPFLVKTSGRPEPMRYDQQFSTLLTQQLILALLAGEVSHSGEIAKWVDAHRSDYPVANDDAHTRRLRENQ